MGCAASVPLPSGNGEAGFIADGQRSPVASPGYFDEAAAIQEVPTRRLLNKHKEEESEEGNADGDVALPGQLLTSSYAYSGADALARTAQNALFLNNSRGIMLSDGQSIELPSTQTLGIVNWSYTFETWFNLNQWTSNNNTLVGCDDGGNNVCLHLQIRDVGAGKRVLYLGHYGQDLAGSTPIQLNTWYHAAFVYNMNSKTQQIYLNGKLDASTGSRDPLKADAKCFLGRAFGEKWLNGIVLRPRFWPVPLTEEAVNKKMTQIQNTVGLKIPRLGCLNLSPAADVIEIADPADLPVPNPNASMASTAIPSTHVALAPTDFLELVNSSFTFESWVYLDKFSSTGINTILGSETAVPGQSIYLCVSSRKPFMDFWGNDLSGLTILKEKTWYHLSFRYNVSTREQSIFVNGQLDATKSNASPLSSSCMVSLGMLQSKNFLCGKIATPRLWKAALPNDEIFRLAYDDPALNGVVRWSNLLPRDGVKINAANQCIPVGSTAQLGIANSSYTFEAWVRIDAMTGSDCPLLAFSLPTGAVANAGLHLVIRGSKPYLGHYADDHAGTTVLEASKWYHLAFRFDLALGEMAIFVNGRQDSSSRNHKPLAGDVPLSLGASCQISFLNGTLARPRLWKSTLPDVEIAKAALGLDLDAALKSNVKSSFPVDEIIPFAATAAIKPCISADLLGLTGASFTFETWIQMNALPATGKVMTILGSVTPSSGALQNNRLMLGVSDKRLSFSFQQNDSAGRIKLGISNFYHVTFIYDSVAGTQTLYVNGFKDRVDPNHPPLAGTAGIMLGYSTDALPFNGNMFRPRLWNWAFSDQEIQERVRAYNLSAPLPPLLSDDQAIYPDPPALSSSSAASVSIAEFRHPKQVGTATAVVYLATTKMSASSFYSVGDLSPLNGRLNSASSWSVADGDLNKASAYLQIEIIQATNWLGLDIQGRKGVGQWITSFQVSYSVNGRSYFMMDEMFHGATDSETVNRIFFETPVYAKFLRVHPKTWYSYPSLRLEAYTDSVLPSSADRDPLSDNLLPLLNAADVTMTASSTYDASHSVSNSLINSVTGSGAWCPVQADINPWIQADFGKLQRILAIDTQGRATNSAVSKGNLHWTQSYAVAYSLDAVSWVYTDEIYQGNTDAIHTVRVVFASPFIARYVRLIPRTFYQNVPALRWMVYADKSVDQATLTAPEEPLTMLLGPSGVPSVTLDGTVGITASNVAANSFLGSASGWIGSSTSQWVQADLKSSHKIRRLAITGIVGSTDVVTSFNVLYSTNGAVWTSMSRLFNGALDSNTPFILHFPQCLVARYVKIVPRTWTGARPALRWQLYAIPGSSNTPVDDVAVDNRFIPMNIQPSTVMTASSMYDSSATLGADKAYGASSARLNSATGAGGWCPQASDLPTCWIQSDFGSVRSVVALDIQGRNVEGEVSGAFNWVTSFSVAYSIDGFYWQSPQTLFPGNFDSSSILRVYFSTPFNARYVKILPKTYQALPALRYEVYTQSIVFFPPLGPGETAANVADTAIYLPKGNILQMQQGSFVTIPNFVFGASFTFEGWFYVRSPNTMARLFDFGNGEGKGVLTLYVASGNLAGMNYTIDGASGCQTLFASPMSVLLDRWNHFALTISTAGTCIVYANGEVASNKTGITFQAGARTNAYLFKSNWAADGFSDISATEIRFWNVMRTQDQIRTYMSRRLSGQEADLAYLFSGDVRGGQLHDSVNSVRAIITGSHDRLENVVRMLPLPLSGASCNNVIQYPLNSYMTIPQIDLSGGYSFECWIYVKRFSSNWSRIFDFGNGENNCNCALAFKENMNTLNYTTTTPSDPMNLLVASSALPFRRWTHVSLSCAVINATQCSATVYMNGEIVCTGTVPFFRTIRRSNFILKSNWAADGSNDGNISEIRIWDHARTQAQFKASMNTRASGSEAGLMHYFSGQVSEGSLIDSVDRRSLSFSPMDIPNLQLWFDPSSSQGSVGGSGPAMLINKATGVGVPAVQWGIDKVQPTYGVLGGSNSQNQSLLGLSIGQNPQTASIPPISINTTFGQAATIMCVLKPDAVQNATSVLFERDALSSSGLAIPSVTMNALGHIELNTASGKASEPISYAGQVIALTLIVDASSTTLYVNNQIRLVSLVGLPAAATFNINFLTRNGRTDNFFKGTFGEILVFNRAISYSQHLSALNYLSDKWGLLPVNMAIATMPGLQCWYDATKPSDEDNGAVKVQGASLIRFQDRSPFGRDLVLSSFKSFMSTLHVVNDKVLPAVSLVNGQTATSSVMTLQNPNTALTFVAVIRPFSATPNRPWCVFEKVKDTSLSLYYNGNGVFELNGGDSVNKFTDISLDKTGPMILSVVCTSKTSTLYINGECRGVSPIGVPSTATLQLSVFHKSDTLTDYARALVSEVLVFDSAIPLSLLFNLESYLSRKWCISQSLVLSTNSTWRQKRVAEIPPGSLAIFASLQCDDSMFNRSVEQCPYDSGPWDARVPALNNVDGTGRKSSSKWIWWRNSISTGDTEDVYFRKVINLYQPSTLCLTFTCDNLGSLFVDGQNISNVSAWESASVVRLQLLPGPHLLQFYVKNLGGPGGLVADIVFTQHATVNGPVANLEQDMVRSLAIAWEDEVPAHLRSVPASIDASRLSISSNGHWDVHHSVKNSKLGSQSGNGCWAAGYKNFNAYSRLLNFSLGAYVDLGGYDFGSSFTFECYYFARTFGTWGRIFDFGNGAGVDNLLLAFKGSTRSLCLSSYGSSVASEIVSSRDFPVGQWVHIACSVGADKKGRLYMDGDLVGTSDAMTFSTVFRNSNYMLRSNWSQDGYNSGAITEMRIWNVQRSDTEIRNNKNILLTGQEPGLALYFAGNCDGSKLVDYTYNLTQRVTVYGANDQAESKLFSFPFPGNNTAQQMLSVSAGTDFRLPALGAHDIGTAFSFECWIRVSQFNNKWPRIFDFCTESNGDSSLALGFWDEEKRLCFRTASDGAWSDLTHDFPFPKREWKHVAVTLNGSSGRLYVDGQLVAANENMLSVQTLRKSNYLLGTNNRPSGLPLGSLDCDMTEIRLWSNCLTPTQIKDRMRTRLVGAEPGIVQYYRGDVDPSTGNLLDSAIRNNGPALAANVGFINQNAYIALAPIAYIGKEVKDRATADTATECVFLDDRVKATSDCYLTAWKFFAKVSPDTTDFRFIVCRPVPNNATSFTIIFQQSIPNINFRTAGVKQVPVYPAPQAIKAGDYIGMYYKSTVTRPINFDFSADDGFRYAALTARNIFVGNRIRVDGRAGSRAYSFQALFVPTILTPTVPIGAAPSFRPSDIPNLVLWLDAQDSSFSGPLWNNKAPGGVCPSLNMLPFTGSSSEFIPNSTSLKGVRIAATQLATAPAVTFPTPRNAFIFISVLVPDATAGRECTIFSNSDYPKLQMTDQCVLSLNDFGNVYRECKGIADYNRRPMIITVTVTASVTTLYVNGEQRGISTTEYPALSCALSLFSRPNATTHSFRGLVCETLVYNSSLPMESQFAVEQYLAMKWKVPQTPLFSDASWKIRLLTEAANASDLPLVSYSDTAWINSIEQAGYSSGPWGSGAAAFKNLGRATSSKWIWNKNSIGGGDTDEVIIRKVFSTYAASTQFTARMTIDNGGELWIDGISYGSMSDWTVGLTSKVSLPAGIHTIVIRAKNEGGCGGILFDMVQDPGPVLTGGSAAVASLHQIDTMVKKCPIIPKGTGYLLTSWDPGNGDFESAYLQFDLAEVRRVTAVEVQGRSANSFAKYNKDQWTITLMVQHSRDGEQWIALPREFQANFNSSNVMRISLPSNLLARYIRLLPKQSNGHPVLRAEVHSYPVYIPLNKLPAAKLTADSFLAWDYGALASNLNSCWMRSAWSSAAPNEPKTWIQVDYGSIRKITALDMQARSPLKPDMGEGDNQWVTSFGVATSLDGQTWDVYPKILPGVTDPNTSYKYVFKTPLYGRYFRVLPKTYYNWMSLRFETYSDSPDAIPLTAVPLELTPGGLIALNSLPSATLTASSALDGSTVPSNAVISASPSSTPYQAWLPTTPAGCWLQSDVGSLKKIVAIGICGRISQSGSNLFIHEFGVAFSADGLSWEASDRKYSGSLDPFSVFRVRLLTPVYARYVKLLPLQWVGYPAARFEVYTDSAPVLFGPSAPSVTSFSPASIPSLQVWLDAADLIGKPLTFWTNKVSGASIASIDLSAYSLALTSITKAAAPGNFPAVSFTAQNTPSAPITVPTTGGSFTIFAVVKYEFANKVHSLVERLASSSSSTASAPLLSMTVANCFDLQSSSSSSRWTDAIVYNIPVVLSICVDGAETSLYINGRRRVTVATSPVVSDGPALLSLFSRAGSKDFMFKGTVGEVLIFSSSLGTASRTSIEGYLLTKWAITALHDSSLNTSIQRGATLSSLNQWEDGMWSHSVSQIDSTACWIPRAGFYDATHITCNFGTLRTVTGFLIQGRPNDGHWITQWTFQWSSNGSYWNTYPRFLSGTFDCNSVYRISVPKEFQIDCTMVRLIPKAYNTGLPALRWAVLVQSDSMEDEVPSLRLDSASMPVSLCFPITDDYIISDETWSCTSQRLLTQEWTSMTYNEAGWSMTPVGNIYGSGTYGNTIQAFMAHYPYTRAKWAWTSASPAALATEKQTAYFRKKVGISKEKAGWWTVTFTAASVGEFYVDSVRVVTSTKSVQTGVTASIYLKEGDHVLSVRVQALLGAVPGFLLALNRATTLPLVSDVKWKCLPSDLTAFGAWTSAGFDDSSWQSAFEQALFRDSPWGAAPASFNNLIMTRAKWIWHNDSRISGDNITNSMRRTIDVAFSGHFVITATADNVINVMIDGRDVGSSSDWTQGVSTQIYLTQGRHVIAVRAQNLGGPGGMLFQMTPVTSSAVFPQENTPYSMKPTPGSLVGSSGFKQMYALASLLPVNTEGLADCSAAVVDLYMKRSLVQLVANAAYDAEKVSKAKDLLFQNYILSRADGYWRELIKQTVALPLVPLQDIDGNRSRDYALAYCGSIFGAGLEQEDDYKGLVKLDVVKKFMSDSMRTEWGKTIQNDAALKATQMHAPNFAFCIADPAVRKYMAQALAEYMSSAEFTIFTTCIARDKFGVTHSLLSKLTTLDFFACDGMADTLMMGGLMATIQLEPLPVLATLSPTAVQSSLILKVQGLSKEQQTDWARYFTLGLEGTAVCDGYTDVDALELAKFIIELAKDEIPPNDPNDATPITTGIDASQFMRDVITLWAAMHDIGAGGTPEDEPGEDEADADEYEDPTKEKMDHVKSSLEFVCDTREGFYAMRAFLNTRAKNLTRQKLGVMLCTPAAQMALSSKTGRRNGRFVSGTSKAKKLEKVKYKAPARSKFQRGLARNGPKVAECCKNAMVLAAYGYSIYSLVNGWDQIADDKKAKQILELVDGLKDVLEIVSVTGKMIASKVKQAWSAAKAAVGGATAAGKGAAAAASAASKAGASASTKAAASAGAIAGKNATKALGACAAVCGAAVGIWSAVEAGIAAREAAERGDVAGTVFASLNVALECIGAVMGAVGTVFPPVLIGAAVCQGLILLVAAIEQLYKVFNSNAFDIGTKEDRILEEHQTRGWGFRVFCTSCNHSCPGCAKKKVCDSIACPQCNCGPYCNACGHRCGLCGLAVSGTKACQTSSCLGPKCAGCKPTCPCCGKKCGTCASILLTDLTRACQTLGCVECGSKPKCPRCGNRCGQCGGVGLADGIRACQTIGCWGPNGCGASPKCPSCGCSCGGCGSVALINGTRACQVTGCAACKCAPTCPACNHKCGGCGAAGIVDALRACKSGICVGCRCAPYCSSCGHACAGCGAIADWAKACRTGACAGCSCKPKCPACGARCGVCGSPGVSDSWRPCRTVGCAGCGNRPPPPSGCFLPGTQVILSDGTFVNIEHVQEGDKVLSFGGSISTRGFEFIHHAVPEGAYIYGLNDEPVFMTPGHALMSIDGWKAVDPVLAKAENPDISCTRLQIGDILLRAVLAPKNQDSFSAPKILYEPVTIQKIHRDWQPHFKKVHGLYLHGQHRSYHANGWIAAMNYPMLTEERLRRGFESLNPEEKMRLAEAFGKTGDVLSKALGLYVNRAFEKAGILEGPDPENDPRIFHTSVTAASASASASHGCGPSSCSSSHSGAAAEREHSCGHSHSHSHPQEGGCHEEGPPKDYVYPSLPIHEPGQCKTVNGRACCEGASVHCQQVGSCLMQAASSTPVPAAAAAASEQVVVQLECSHDHHDHDHHHDKPPKEVIPLPHPSILFGVKE